MIITMRTTILVGFIAIINMAVYTIWRHQSDDVYSISHNGPAMKL